MAMPNMASMPIPPFWYLPQALERRLPHLSLEDHSGTPPEIVGESGETTPEPSLSGVSQ
jgi:hypothetical protein